MAVVAAMVAAVDMVAVAGEATAEVVSAAAGAVANLDGKRDEVGEGESEALQLDKSCERGVNSFSRSQWSRNRREFCRGVPAG